jgi:hypothetical protein
MVQIAIEPDTFEMVFYDAAVIAEIAGRMAVETGLDVDAVLVRVDETTPLATAKVTGHEPFVVDAQGGAFEDTRQPRHLSERRTADTLGRLFLRTRDRRTPGFGPVPDDDELSLRQWAAWDTYSVGRLVALGHDGQYQRRLYQFRSRHGFTDRADAAFTRLWTAREPLTWADIEAASAAAVAPEARSA